MIIDIQHFIAVVPAAWQEEILAEPWELTQRLPDILWRLIARITESEYHIQHGIAIHRSAIVEEGAVIKAPVVIGKDCFVGAHAYLRGGVYLEEKVKIGPGCEIKSSLILSGSALAHFNFAGDSLVGNQVNIEAGAILANHYNERTDKTIFVHGPSGIFSTGTARFGALLGDGCRIGANAVLSPGTLLEKNTVVGRLQLVEQHPVP